MSGEGRRLQVTLINKDDTQGAEVTLESARDFTSGEMIRLTAPAMDSKDHISLAGSEVSSEGQWSSRGLESLRPNRRAYKVQVPAGSALIIGLLE